MNGPTGLATRHGQYFVTDLGSTVDLRYVWVECVGGTERNLAAFHLFTDAAQMTPHYQRRETAERAA